MENPSQRKGIYLHWQSCTLHGSILSKTCGWFSNNNPKHIKHIKFYQITFHAKIYDNNIIFKKLFLTSAHQNNLKYIKHIKF